MIVIHDFPARLLSYLKQIKGKTIFFFAVDQWVFERDIDRGFLGEAIASKLIFPYTPLEGQAYLHERKLELEKRLVVELLENLVINFPELAQRIQIKPKYFMYEVFSSRIRVFPLLNYEVADLTRSLTQNEDSVLAGYISALRQLEAEQKIQQKDGYTYITKKFIDTCQDPKKHLLNLAKNMPRRLFSSLFGVVPQLMSIVTQNAKTFLRTQKINWSLQMDQTTPFIDPLQYVFLQTSEGLVSLSDKIDVKGYAQRLVLKDPNAEVEVQPIGGMLNDVYLITAGERKVLAKRFKDWSGFKWFPLSVWSFGARPFAVSGQARLAKECAISEILHGEGFNVPQLYYVSNAERLVFMEFIEAENLAKIVKNYGLVEADAVDAAVLGIVNRVGETIARVHAHNVVLGDTKPDNVLIKADGSIFLIDFEQAQQGGDRAWDIAVFLYYCGHYLQRFDSNDKAEAIATAFIDGYLQVGGNLGDVHKAGMPKYTRVFSIFTMPSLMLTISSVCKKAQLKK